MPEISVVIPVFRSASVLGEVHSRVSGVLSTIGRDFEIVFVEDGGGDNTWQVVQALAAADARVRGLRMSRNFGQHNATLAGIRSADGAFIVTMDDDLQHPPEELPKLLMKLNEGFDVVYGVPIKAQHGVVRNMCSRLTKYILAATMGATNAGITSSFRLFRSQLRSAFESCHAPAVNIDVLLSWATTKFTSCPVHHDERSQGKSGYDTRRLIGHAINMVTGFSTVPLRLASFIGFFFAFFGVIVLAFVVGRYLLQGGSVPGFSFLASIVAIFSGAQLVALGMFGEYIARMYERNMGKPTYLVAERTVGSGQKR